MKESNTSIRVIHRYEEINIIPNQHRHKKINDFASYDREEEIETSTALTDEEINYWEVPIRDDCIHED